MCNSKSHKFIPITVSVGIILVAWQTLAGPLNYWLQLVLFIVAIFTLGIPHGAFDYLVNQELCQRDKSLFRGFIFRLKYLFAIVSYGFFWYFVPQFSLLTFLLISSWHFGETDLRKAITMPALSNIVRLAYGACVLSWIVFGHAAESRTIIRHLVPAEGVMFQLWLAGVNYSKLILFVSAFFIITALSISHLQKKRAGGLWSTIQLIIILACCYLLPLLPAFALYFVGWHSIITLNNVGRFINSRRDQEKPLTIGKLCMNALPASLIAIGCLFLIGYLFRNVAPFFDPLPLMLVLLSHITLPHIQVM